MFNWPIYGIGIHKKIWEDNNVLYIITDTNRECIIDNKNIQANTLGKRRIALKGQKLYNLKKVCYTLVDVFSCKSELFIDSEGKLLKLNKNKSRTLIYRKVMKTKIVNVNKLHCICEGIFKPIEISFIPKVMPKYLGLLIVNGDYYVYELSQEWKKDTWRLW